MCGPRRCGCLSDLRPPEGGLNALVALDFGEEYLRHDSNSRSGGPSESRIKPKDCAYDQTDSAARPFMVTDEVTGEHRTRRRPSDVQKVPGPDRVRPKRLRDWRSRRARSIHAARLQRVNESRAEATGGRLKLTGRLRRAGHRERARNRQYRDRQVGSRLHRGADQRGHADRQSMVPT